MALGPASQQLGHVQTVINKLILLKETFRTEVYEAGLREISKSRSLYEPSRHGYIRR